MKKIGMIVVALVVAAAAFWFLGGRSLLSEPAVTNGGSGYRTATLARRSIGSTVLATGVIRPQVGAEVQVGSRASGVLIQLHANIGDPVRAGQLLAVLDPTEFLARRDQAAAQLEAAKAEHAYAEVELERATQMLDAELIPQSQFDVSDRAFNMAVAQVRQLEATLQTAEIQLGYTRIHAPIAGVVAGVSTQVGETVAASFAAPTFVTIIDLDRLEVWAYVDETDIGRVEVGQTATFTVDTYTDTEFTGAVSAIQPRAEIIDNVVNYVTLLDIGDRQGKTLRPEMTTTVNIVIDGRENVVAIPNGAVRRDSEGQYAYLSGADGPVRRAIRTGYRGSSYTEVLEGLDAGDTVILGSVTVGT